MSKKVLFTVALLAPGLAYAANPTANLSVQVVPAGTAGTCGAIMGQAATDAAAAGFNTCAHYSDWTTQIPNTVGTGLPTNWLNPNNSGWDGVSHWYCGHGFVNGPGFVCDMFSQATDPVFGNKALLIQAGGSAPKSISFTTMAYNGTPSYGIATFPDGAYYEMTWRYNTNDIVDLYAMGLWGDPIDWLGCPASGDKGYLEQDFFQLGVDVGGASLSPAVDWWGCGDRGRWDTVGGGSIVPDMTQYHTVGWLSTTNGNGVNAVCSYWDGTRTECKQFNYNDPVEYAEHRWMLFEWRTCGVWDGDTSCRSLPWPNVNTYIKDIKVMSCANWQQSGDAGSCHGSALNGTGFYQ